MNAIPRCSRMRFSIFALTLYGEVHGILHEQPESGDIFLQRALRGRAFVHAGLVMTVDRDGCLNDHTMPDTLVGVRIRLQAGTLDNPEDTVRGSALLAYWISSLHVLAEGWGILGLTDPAVDQLLASAHVDALRRYRNVVYHFQLELNDPRFAALETSHEVIDWVLVLGGAFQDFFEHHSDAIDVEHIRLWLFAPAATAF
jgi:hypothetical protein